MLKIIYPSFESATNAANIKTRESCRYWTALRYDADGWYITSFYHPA